MPPSCILGIVQHATPRGVLDIPPTVPTSPSNVPKLLIATTLAPQTPHRLHLPPSAVRWQGAPPGLHRNRLHHPPAKNHRHNHTSVFITTDPYNTPAFLIAPLPVPCIRGGQTNSASPCTPCCPAAHALRACAWAACMHAWPRPHGRSTHAQVCCVHAPCIGRQAVRWRHAARAAHRLTARQLGADVVAELVVQIAVHAAPLARRSASALLQVWSLAQRAYDAPGRMRQPFTGAAAADRGDQGGCELRTECVDQWQDSSVGSAPHVAKVLAKAGAAAVAHAHATS